MKHFVKRLNTKESKRKKQERYGPETRWEGREVRFVRLEVSIKRKILQEEERGRETGDKWKEKETAH